MLVIVLYNNGAGSEGGEKEKDREGESETRRRVEITTISINSSL